MGHNLHYVKRSVESFNLFVCRSIYLSVSKVVVGVLVDAHLCKDGADANTAKIIYCKNLQTQNKEYSPY